MMHGWTRSAVRATQACHTGRMSQTSTERLRDYLAQLPPQSQALLMREFERAIERGEDTAVATFVLEQLRKIVRGAEEDDERGRAPTIRRGCCSARSSRFLSKAIFRCGRARSAARRCCRCGNGWSATARPSRRANSKRRWRRIAQTGRSAGLEVRGPQIPARRGRGDLQDRHAGAGGDKQRALARVGPPECDRGPAADRLGPAGPRSAGYAQQPAAQLSAGVRGSRRSRRSAPRSTFPRCKRRRLLPFALSLVMQRLTAPWQIIRLAIKMAASDDEIRVAATPYGIAVTIALHDLSFLAASLRTDIRRGHFENVAEHLKILHDGVRGLRTELDLRNDSAWGRQLASIRADISNALQSEIDSVPGRVRRILRQRADKDIPSGARVDADRGRGNRRTDRFRRGVPHLCQRTRDQRGHAADLFRPAALCRAVHRGAGAIAARRRRQGARLPADAGRRRRSASATSCSATTMRR